MKPLHPKILLIRPDRVGDVIVSSVCLPAVREHYKDCKIYFMAPINMKPLFELHPLIDGFIPFPNLHGKLETTQIQEMQDIFNNIAPDIVFHLHPHSATYAGAAFAKKMENYGINQGFWSWILDQKIPFTKHDDYQHEAEHTFDILSLVGIKKPNKLRASINLRKEDLESLRKKIPWVLEKEKYTVLNVTAHVKAARWPTAYFEKVAQWLIEEKNQRVIINGAHIDDLSVIDFLNSETGKHPFIFNSAGKLNLGELGWLLQKAEALVSRNTGASHLAAAVDCPQVDLFARITPLYSSTRWHPLSDKCIVLETPVHQHWYESNPTYWKRSHAAILPEQVIESLKQLEAFKII
jgi:ADP-heptose:LPS heptosyltransferase